MLRGLWLDNSNVNRIANNQRNSQVCQRTGRAQANSKFTLQKGIRRVSKTILIGATMHGHAARGKDINPPLSPGQATVDAAAKKSEHRRRGQTVTPCYGRSANKGKKAGACDFIQPCTCNSIKAWACDFMQAACAVLPSTNRSTPECRNYNSQNELDHRRSAANISSLNELDHLQ